MARAAEGAGFDSIWLGDHLLYRGDGGPERGPWEVWTMLAGLAAVTSRVALGPLVACTAFHPPGLIAKMAAAVDEISGGRLVLGLGAGWNEAEFRAFGLPYDHRVTRFAEAFEIIRGMLAGERVTLEGRFWQADDLVLLPPPARRPPIMIGSNGPRMLGLTLPHVDSWNTWYDWYGNTADGFAAANRAISDAARRAGRDPRHIERSACVLVARRVRQSGPTRTRRRRSAVTPGGSPDTCMTWRRPERTRRSWWSTRSPRSRSARWPKRCPCSTPEAVRYAGRRDTGSGSRPRATAER